MVRAAGATLAAALACCLLIPDAAQAGGGEHMVTIRPEYTYSTAHGAGLSLGYQWGIDDFWNLWIETGWANIAEQFPERAKPVLTLLYGNAGIVFNIDAFEWVPYLVTSFGATAALPSEGDNTAVFTMAAGGGLDYRPAREWAVGLFVHYHI
ncbi:MAG: opacity protein-like surface antigen, partial [Myxococcota bacterium]